MKLISVTIENFRSISAARKIALSDLTTLVGPNNEGKSNILGAITIAMRALKDRGSTLGERVGLRSRDRALARHVRGHQSQYYDWVKDCPIKLQKKSGAQGSKFVLEFSLNSDEVGKFREEIGVRLNGSLPISLEVLKDQAFSISIPKQGPGGSTLNAKTQRVASFVADRIDIQYIPAVRTAESAYAIIEELVEQELASVEADPRFQAAIQEISALQGPILDQLSKNVLKTMSPFMPSLKLVKVAIQDDARTLALRRTAAVLLDDGAETALNAKGDGVQSLAALSLMSYVSSTRNLGKNLLIALEEPESHLHPAAIRQLRSVLMDISKLSQVVLTTHNPLFTNRNDAASNVIVYKNKAYSAKNVKEVRDVLGVRLDDNLSSAEVVLVVEGLEDKVVLQSVILTDARLKDHFTSGRLAIDILGGAGNLTHRLRLHQDQVCKTHVFLDADASGRRALELAEKEGVVDNKSMNLAAVPGKLESEMEDLFIDGVYSDIVTEETGLKWETKGSDDKQKWSDRLKNLLRRAGKNFDDLTIMNIKIKVAQNAAAIGINAFQHGKIGPITSLMNSLSAKLGD